MESRQHQQPEAAKGVSPHQKNVMRRVIIATSLAVILSAVAYQIIPTERFKSLQTPADRLVYTVRCNALTVGMLFVMIAHIGNTRFLSKQINPLATDDKDRIDIHGRVLQNTLEQFVLSFALQLSTSTWLEPTQMAIIPIVVCLFVVGRILFWHGYLNPANERTNRAIGLPLTLNVSLAMFVFNVYKLITS